jgi:phage/plasmid-like protein (TIGR03299 family)
MAHMIEVVDGFAHMAYAGETPWHGLGVKVPNDVSPEQMLKAAKLDWTVTPVPAFAMIDGVETSVNRSALVRSSDNKVLDVITNDWEPCQNQEAFEFFNDFVAAGDMEMHTAGSLADGRIVWALAKVNDSFELFGGDKVESFLLFTNPHSYGQSIDVRFTPIRVVCNNTLSLALAIKGFSGSTQVVKVSHRRKFDGDAVKQTLGVAKDKLAQYKEMAAFLGQKRYTNETLGEYFNRVFPVITSKVDGKKEVSKNAKIALDIINQQPGANFAEGTWWQAFNTVTFMADHVIGRTADARLRSAWFGQNRTLKTNALETAVEFAEAA